MDLKTWRAKQQEKAVEAALDLELPSGLTIKARRPDPAQLLTWRRLPLSLAGELQNGEAEESGPMSKADVLDSIEVTRQLLLYCYVSPRISLTPQGDDEIHPREIPDEDLAFVTRWAMRMDEADRLRPFRTVRADDLAGRDGEDVRNAAVGAAGDRGSDAGAGDRPGGGAGDRTGSKARIIG